MRFLFFCLMIFTSSNLLLAQTDNNSTDGFAYNIHLKITPYKSEKIYLGTYYGKNQIAADSLILDEKGEGDFKGSSKLAQGIYFLVSPDHKMLFELLMDAGQHFSVEGNVEDPSQITIKGSSENTLFMDYTQYLAVLGPTISGVQQSLKTAANKADSTKIYEELAKLNNQLNTYRENIITDHPASMLALLLTAIKTPERPQIPTLADGTKDSAYPFYYVKDHYWDGINFYDNRLLHTPFFDTKLENYFKYYVAPNPDSVIAEVNYILLSARSGKDIFRYMLARFTDKYVNPEIMGMDRVFVFLFENFYSKGDTSWLSEKQRKFIFDRAYSLIANQINEPAPQLNLVDSSNKPVSLYDIESPFTFIVFWDPHCSHCKLQVPRLDSFYNAQWKNWGVTVLAVNTNEVVLDDWKSFINDNHLDGWYHAYQPREQRLEEEKNNQANYRQLYDIQQTPTFFLLDENKRIIAKGLSLEQFSSLMQTKISLQKKSEQ